MNAIAQKVFLRIAWMVYQAPEQLSEFGLLASLHYWLYLISAHCKAIESDVQYSHSYHGSTSSSKGCMLLGKYSEQSGFMYSLDPFRESSSQYDNIQCKTVKYLGSMSKSKASWAIPCMLSNAANQLQVATRLVNGQYYVDDRCVHVHVLPTM